MAKLKSKKLSKTAIRNASIAAASAAVAGVLTGCSLYGNDTYTVKFNTVGGSSVESQKIVWGEKINNPASPTKEGYTFDGWYLDANYKTKVDEVNYVVEGDVEFFAKWKINSYTITFATNGGEEIDPITKNFNSTIAIDDPEREGYIFSGWYLDAALTKPFDMVVPSSDTTVYAKWIACELTITFDKNSEEAVGEMEVQTIKTNATLNQISTNTFKREGYTFAGWAISPEGEVAYQENETISLVNQNKEITLYAVWEANDYTVSFIANNEEFATFTGDYRSQFTLPNNTPTRNGYTFVNWGTYKLTEDEKFKGEKQYFSNVGTEKEPIYELISVVDGADVAAGLYYEIVEYTNRDIPLNGLKLFAIFTKNTYTISFNTNGGSAIANISSLYGEEITKPASPTKEGYTFKGWFTSQGQTNDDWGNEYIVFSTMPSNSFTLYAKWEINNYALSFNSNGGNEIDPLNKAFGSEVILPSLTRTGYTFKGWATSLDGEVTYLAGAKYTITSSSQVLHAVWEIKSLTISFEENGGSEVLDITQEYNSSITQPENPSRVGYTFEGWFTDKTFKNEYVFSTMPEENVTLYAKWNINQYTISFNTLGGSEINPITQNYDSTISSPSSPTKTGHSFAGWYLDEECTKEYTISKMPAENITLYAKWEINQYTISFNTLGGNVIDSITQNYNTSVTQPENPSRVGYTFDGWYSDRSCSIEYTFSNMPAENITLFAGWTLNSYSISFNVDGGSEVATIKQDYNTSLAKPNNPSKLGYSFAGWYLDEECTIAYTFPSTMPAENITLYAKWEINQYTITFNTNGGSDVAPITLDYNSSLVRPADPSKVGRTFAGWYSNIECTKPYIFPDKMPAENVTVYAKWSVNSYTVSFNVNGGDTLQPITMKYNESFYLPTPTKTGHTFLGWATSLDGEVVYSENAIYTLGATNVTLYAKWNINQYTISFNTKGGDVVSPITQDYNTILSMPTNPSRVGYTFDGWYLDETLTSPFSSSRMPAENITLYAKWNVNSYTVSFNVDGGGAISPITEEFSSSITLPTPTKTGHTFLGWAITPEGEVAYQENASYTFGATNVTLYAKWNINQYSITFEENGGSSVTDITLNYNELITKPTNPTKEGHSFAGWYLDSNYQTLYSIPNTMPATNVTVYAKWNINSYTISFDSNDGVSINPVTSIYNSEITLPSTTKTGYHLLGWALVEDDISNIRLAGEKYSIPSSNVTLHAIWEANTNTKYVVNHYGANLTGGGYTPIISENLEGTTDAMTSVEYVSTLDKLSPFYGFEGVMAITQEKIKPDGTTVINLYYQRRTYTVSFVDEEGNPLCSPINVIYQGNVGIIPSELVRTGYDYLLSDDFTAETIIEENVTIVVTYDARETSIAFYNYPTNENPNIQTIVRDYGTDISSLVIEPIRTGYTFEGWFTLNGESSGNWGEEYSFTTMPAESIDLYAKWSVNQYTLSFNTNGGDSISSVTQDYGSSYTLPFATKTGHTFLGWAASLDGEVVATGNINYTFVAQNVTLYAKWEVNQYTISFEENGGSLVDNITQDYGTDITVPSNPTLTGHTFKGWFKDKECTQEYDFPETMPAENITLYAKWEVNTYTISFEENGGSEVEDITQDYNSSLLMPNNPTLTGYTFDGWYLDDACTNPFTLNKMPAENITLYAKWEVNQYTISFDVDNGNPVSSITKDFNTVINLPTPTKTGHTFLGWATSQGGEVVYREEASYTFGASNVTLYAKWEVNEYSLSFIESDGSTLSSIKLDYGSSYTLHELEKEGHTFAGWATSQGGSVVYRKGEAYTIGANNASLYAVWIVNQYTISFISNGGDNVASITQNYGTSLVMPSNPEKTGYTFKGWHTDEECTEAYSFPSTMPAGNVTLYAKWEVNQYTITINTVGGSDISPIIQNYNTAITQPTDPTKLGHSFGGWYSDSSYTTTYSFPSTMPATNVTVYAKWNVNSYTIAFEEKGGSTVNNITQNYGTAISVPTNPTLTGYTFKGWHTDVECTEAYSFPSTMPAGNITLYAKWEINKYTVSFNSNGGDVVEAMTINYKDIVTQPTDPTKLGHSFAGWYSDPQFKSIYSFGQEMPAESFTLYAKWNVNSYTISFEENGGSTVNNITQNYGTSLVMPSNPTLTGYEFKGWYLDKEFTEAYEFPSTMPAGNITLYAKWEIKQFTVSFEENGGSSVTDITLDYQANITRPSDPTKDGHTFAGWYLDPQFKFVYSFGQMPAENITVYAKWNVNSYMFTLVNDGIVTSNQVLAYGSTLNLPTLTKYGYEFKGWALIEDGEVEYEGNSLYSITSENVTLYAIWDVKQVTYKFSVNGIVKNTITNDYDSDFSVANPTSYSDENNTYYFAGWKEKDAEENAPLYDFSNGSKLGMENKEYVAVFNSVPYTIKYQNKNGGTTLWETSSSEADSSFKQYIAYLYQRQNGYQYINKAIQDAVTGKVTNDSSLQLSIVSCIVYFNLKYNNSNIDVGGASVPFNSLPQENQVVVLSNGTSQNSGLPYSGDYVAVLDNLSKNTISYLSVFEKGKDQTYMEYIMNFLSDNEKASTATSEYLTLVSAELTKYEDNAYNPYRNDGYIFNGWKTTIDADNENPTKYVYASWVKQIEAPENLHVSTIAKTYVEFSWNQVENAYGYYVNYSINGEAKPTIATQENKVPINVSANDTIEISITTINADENGNRFETSNAYETPSLKDENITLTQESVSLNSEPCSPISYTHVITGEQEITASGDFFYKTEYGELYLFSNSSYTFKNVVAMEIISGNSFARITDQNGTPTLTTGSNAGTITFRTYKVASGTAKENETYYSYVDGSYSLVSVEVGSSVEGYYLGEEHIAKISLLVSNIGLGTELYSYTSAQTSGDYLNTTEFDAYLIGAALTDSSLYTEYASGNYSNGFKFDFDINTTSGNILDFSTFPLEYTFYELDGNEWKEVSDPSSLYIYDEEQDVFYFLKSSGQYKVSISFKKDGYYETKDSSLDPNKKYYYLENGEYKLFDHENPVDATTYYEHFVNVSLPNAFKERNISKEFEFTLNDGINVFNDYGLKQAFSNKNVSSINLHSTIKSEFNSHSISYIPYLEDTGLSTKMSHSYMKYGELDIVSGTAEMTDNPSYGPLCWKQSSSTTSELDAAGTFYFLDKSGVVYVYDYTNGTHAIKDCEWKEVYGNTETKVGKFKILNDAFGNDPTYNNYGLSVGSIYTRANKESVDLKVNGNYFTIDASDLPYVMSTYGNVAGNGIVASYKIQNVKVSIFDIISGTGTSFENMSVIGNTENASETLSGSSGESLTISEQMEKTSGGILAFKNMYIGSDINLDNINISKATIGVHTTYLANATINYTHVWDIWANSIYASGGDTTSVSNSVIDPSGGASFHIEDNFYTIDDKGSGYAYNGVIVNNSGVVTNPTFDLGYISTHANNLVSGEEQWFKAYSMEIVAMGMKSTLESAVQNDINPQIGSNYTILQTVTDPVTNLTSEKMNFVFLGKTHNINQSNTAINLDDVKVDFTFGGPIINTQTTNQGIVYTIAKEEVENPQDAEIIYNVLCVPLPEDLGTLYFITSPDGSTTLKAYFFFKNKLSATEIIYGMVELYEKQ